MMKKLCRNEKARIGLILVCAIVFLTITNYTKVLRGGDTITRDLYWNSENLVYNAMVLEYYAEEPAKYGLTDLYPYNGSYISALTDEEKNIFQGYSEIEPFIVVNYNENTEKIFGVGNTLTFFSGDKAEIVGNHVEGEWLYVEYAAEKQYTCNDQGDLRYVLSYSNVENRYYRMGEDVAYESQIGLQGMFFSSYPKENTIADMKEGYKWRLSGLLAVVITLISYGIYKKYNLLFGMMFFIVTAISPWIIGYATNLYWVEFTWFLPMLFGIYCANHIESKAARFLSYIGTMISIFIKCACGYEFITTIMLSVIVFLLADFTAALLEKEEKEKTKRLFWTIFWMGIFALLGFALALVWHSYIRGNGNILIGLRTIYYNDVLRRTFGDANMFQDVYADSLNASVLRVLLRYLIFKTPLVLGVSGYLFIPLAAASFFVLVYRVWKKGEDKQMLALYIWMGIASVSWFVLGKSHSYIHTAMNFVMWYFGYVQIMLYVLVQAVWNKIKKMREERMHEKR